MVFKSNTMLFRLFDFIEGNGMNASMNKMVSRSYSPSLQVKTGEIEL